MSEIMFEDDNIIRGQVVQDEKGREYLSLILLETDETLITKDELKRALALMA